LEIQLTKFKLANSLHRMNKPGSEIVWQRMYTNQKMVI